MPLAQEKRYTYADVLTWDDDTRYELYDGQPVALASPSNRHQRISFELSRQLGNYLLGKRCQAYHAPFDVQLFAGKSDKPRDIDTVVQPDIAVVCDESKTAGHGCKGAPDLIIEILSPSSMQYDQFIKLDLYRKAGVKEYWIVDSIKNTISVYLLEGRHYRSPVTYGADAKIPVSILEGCKIDLGLVFS